MPGPNPDYPPSEASPAKAAGGLNVPPEGQGNGEVDEFANLPAPRRRLPWPALVVMLLSAYLIYHQRSDIAYALSSRSPQVLGAAPALFQAAPQALPENRYVRIEGSADFESAVVLDTQGEWKFRSFFRLLDTGGRIFVQRMPGPLPSELAEQSHFAGRLVKLSTVSFSDAIRRYYAKHVAATHVFEVEGVRAALDKKRWPASVSDRLGGSVTLAGNDVLAFDVREAQMFKVEVPGDFYTQLANARKAVESTGARVRGEGRPVPRETGSGAYAFEVEVSAGEEAAVLSALTDLGSRMRIEPVVTTVEARIVDIASGRAAVTFHHVLRSQDGGADSVKDVPWERVVGVRTTDNLEIPSDAYLLLEGEKPASQIRAVIAAAFLLAFAIINALAWRRL